MVADLAEYMDAEDRVGRWLAECTVKVDAAWTKSTDAFNSYKEWAKPREEYVPSQTRFTGWLTDRGIRKRKSGGQVFDGFRLRVASDDADHAQGVDDF